MSEHRKEMELVAALVVSRFAIRFYAMLTKQFNEAPIITPERALLAVRAALEQAADADLSTVDSIAPWREPVKMPIPDESTPSTDHPK